MFKLHSIKPEKKESKDKSMIFGERVKYIYWFNSEVLLSCHVKRIVQKIQDSCVESHKVLVVYKLIAHVQTIQNFIKDFMALGN